MKSSIQDYNNLEYSNSCSLPLTITFDAVKDPDSDVWMEAHASGESATAVPVSIRRKAIDLYHLRNRCQEEISLLQSEMENTLEHFIQQHQLLLSTLDDGSDNGSFEGRGRDIFIRGKILSLESYIVHLKVLFEGYIGNVSSPSLIFQNDLSSLDQQANMSSESAGIHEETPCLISLPEIETGTFDGSDSDSEDDDDEYEDHNISLLTLDLLRQFHNIWQQLVYQAPVVQKVACTIYWINRYPADNKYQNQLGYMLVSDSSSGLHYPTFEQVGPEVMIKTIF